MVYKKLEYMRQNDLQNLMKMKMLINRWTIKKRI
jgi:hypothetical protein